MNGYIYKITNTKNGKVYIGQTVQKPEARFKAHINELNAGKKKNSKFQKAWSKYGKESFEFTVLLSCDESRLDDYERYYISLYDSFKNGYNATIGGKQCMERRKHTRKVKLLLSDKAKTLWENAEYKDHMKKVHSANRAVICVNTKAIYRTSMDAANSINADNSNMIRACNCKTMACGKAKNGDPLLWAWLDEYTGYSPEEMHEGYTGGNNRRAVKNLDTGMVFESATKAAQYYKCSKSTISKACKGELKTAASYRWCFA